MAVFKHFHGVIYSFQSHSRTVRQHLASSFAYMDVNAEMLSDLARLTHRSEATYESPNVPEPRSFHAPLFDKYNHGYYY